MKIHSPILLLSFTLTALSCGNEKEVSKNTFKNNTSELEAFVDSLESATKIVEVEHEDTVDTTNNDSTIQIKLPEPSTKSAQIIPKKAIKKDSSSMIKPPKAVTIETVKTDTINDSTTNNSEAIIEDIQEVKEAVDTTAVDADELGD